MKPTDESQRQEDPGKLAATIARRFSSHEAKFSGDVTENWNEYVDNYRQISFEHQLNDQQMLLFIYNILKVDARLFYQSTVKPHVSTFQQAVDYISGEYNTSVRMNQVVSLLDGLRVSNLESEGMEVPAALRKMYKTILRLFHQCLPSHRGDAHKIGFHRRAVVLYDWSTGPLSRASSESMTYQQLYGKLATSLHQRVIQDNPKFANKEHGSEIATVNFSGQPRVRRGNPHGSRSTNSKRRSPLDIQGCFNCESPDHLLRDCPHSINLARASAKNSNI